MRRVARAARAVGRAGRGRWWRWPYLAALIYSGIVIAGNAVLTGGILVGRATGNDTRLAESDGYPPVRNLRRVDEKLLAGAQPTEDHYRRFAELGVTLVVDLRTGVPGDPNTDDPAFLASLGIDYVRMPLSDGHAPDEGFVLGFMRAVRDHDGQVLVHCGGGVGRSTSLQAAYQASMGSRASILEQLAIGPPTLEQLVYAARARPSDPSPNNALIAGFSRWVVDGPRKAVGWVGARI